MRITKEDIERARELKACKEVIDWAKELNGDELNIENVAPEHLLWAIGNKCVSGELNQALFDFCVREEPWHALSYAKELLSEEQLDFCVNKSPGAALHYAKDKLTQSQLDFCMREDPIKR